MPTRPLSDEKKQRVLNAVQQGITNHAEIAKRTGVSVGSVSNILTGPLRRSRNGTR